MKTLAWPSFFRFFDLFVSTTNPGLKRASWSVEGVSIDRQRHSFSGDGHGFVVETFILTHPGRSGWKLMVVKEYWSFANARTEGRATRWARPLHGKRSDLMTWLREQEKALEEKSPSGIARIE